MPGAVDLLAADREQVAENDADDEAEQRKPPPRDERVEIAAEVDLPLGVEIGLCGRVVLMPRRARSRPARGISSAKGSSRAVGAFGEHEVGEEPGHEHPLAELAHRRLRPLAVRERERELRVAAAGGERQRERAAEARVDVGDEQRPVLLAEALDVRGPQIGSASATRRPCSISSQSLIVMPLIDSPPFDSIIVRGIAFRQRPSKSEKTSIENSSPRHQAWTKDGTGVRARWKSSSSRSSPGRCGASRSPRGP